MVTLHNRLSKFSLTRTVLCFVSAFVVNGVIAASWCNYFDFGLPAERFSQCGNGMPTPLWVGFPSFILLGIAVYPLVSKLVRAKRENKMSEELPFDQGRSAYLTRKSIGENPYDSDDWKNEEWLKGWMHEEETDSEQAWDWAENRFKS